jgi:hypothetical protein
MDEPFADWVECPACEGDGGEVIFGGMLKPPYEENRDTWARCEYCHGRGRVPPDPAQYRDCQECDGTGYLIWGGGESASTAHVELCPCGGGDSKSTVCGGARLVVRDHRGNKIDAVAHECHCCGGTGVERKKRGSAV